MAVVTDERFSAAGRRALVSLRREDTEGREPFACAFIPSASTSTAPELWLLCVVAPNEKEADAEAVEVVGGTGTTTAGGCGVDDLRGEGASAAATEAVVAAGVAASSASAAGTETSAEDEAAPAATFVVDEVDAVAVAMEAEASAPMVGETVAAGAPWARSASLLSPRVSEACSERRRSRRCMSDSIFLNSSGREVGEVKEVPPA